MEYILAISAASIVAVVCWIISFFIDKDNHSVNEDLSEKRNDKRAKKSDEVERMICCEKTG